MELVPERYHFYGYIYKRYVLKSVLFDGSNYLSEAKRMALSWIYISFCFINIFIPSAGNSKTCYFLPEYKNPPEKFLRIFERISSSTVLLFAGSLDGAEVAGDDIPHDGRCTLVLFLPCCLDPAQMFHVVSYLARTIRLLEQLKHVDLLQEALECAALPRPADFLREQDEDGVFDFGEVRIVLWAKAEVFCHSDFPEVICEAAARKSERHPLVKTDCCTYHDSVQPSIKISMSHKNTPFLMNQNHRFACPARRSCLLAILS